MERFKRIAKKVGKIFGFTLLGIVGLVLLALGGLVIALRTDWGHRKVLAIAQPILKKALAAQVTIGRLDGNILGGLSLSDVELRDVEGEPAAHIAKITLHYGLLTLLHHRVEVRDATIEGAWARVRYLKDGRINFAALTPVASEVLPSPSPTPSGGTPFVLSVKNVKFDGEGAYEPDHLPPPGKSSVEMDHIVAKLTLAGGVKVTIGEKVLVEAHVDSLDAQTTSPTAAQLHVAGGLKVDDGIVSFQKVAIKLDADGRNLNPLLPAGARRLRGPIALAVEGDGPLTDILLKVQAALPKGTLDVNGHFGVGDVVKWSGQVDAKGIDPAALVRGAPAGVVELHAKGDGHDGTGNVDVAQLNIAVTGIRASIQGRGNLQGKGLATIDIDARDLSSLRGLGIGLPNGIGGSVVLKATLKRERNLTVSAELNARNLRGFGARIDQIALNAQAVDFQGKLHLASRGLHYGTIALPHLWVDADGSKESVAVKLAAEGPRNTRAEVALHGAPPKNGVIDVMLDDLKLMQDKREVHSVGATHVVVASAVTVDTLHLQSGTQELTLRAHYVLASQAVDAHLALKGIDGQQLQAWLPASLGTLPKSAIDVTVDASGTVPSPNVKLTVDGHTERFARWRGGTQLVIDPVTLKVSGQYANKRAQVSANVAGPDIQLAADAEVPIPLTMPKHGRANGKEGDGEPPMHANIKATVVKIEQFAGVLPPRLAGLKGKLTLDVQAKGTLRHPDLDVKIDTPWVWSSLTDNHTTLALSYHAPQLSLSFGTSLRKGAAGTLKAQIALPLDLGAILVAPQRTLKFILTTLGKETPLKGDIALSGVDLERLDLASLGVDLPITAGALDGKIDFGGTALDPTIHVKFDALHLQKAGVNATLDLNLQAVYDKAEAQASVRTALAGAPLLQADGQMKVDTRPLFDGKPAQIGELAATVKVAAFDLSRLRGVLPSSQDVQGTLTVDGQIGGPFAQLRAKLDAAFDQLKLGGMGLPRVELTAGLNQGVVTVAFDTKEDKGGSLHADAKLATAGNAPLVAHFNAKAFDLGFLVGLLPQLSKVQGRLDAALAVNSPLSNLVPTGTVALSGGAVALRGDAHTYDQIGVSVGLDPGLLTLKSLGVHSGKGWLKANGTVKLLAGLGIGNVTIDATARQFLLTLGSAAAWLDADIMVRGERQGALTKVVTTVKQGTVNLPKIEAGRSLQSTDPLKYVSYDDKKQRAADRKQELASTQLIDVHLPGPFHIRAKEANIDLKGDLDVKITGSDMRLTGAIQSTYGWIDLFGRRYDIERAGVVFQGNPSNPHLDVRISRAVSDAVIAVGVSGSASKPKLELTSTPPVYDESEILGLVLSGDPGNSRASESQLNSEVVGTISGLVVSQIKNVLAPKLPIDVVKINNDEYSGVGDTRLEIGKYITQNIYVSYVHQFGVVQSIGAGASNSNEGHLEYRFKRRYELDTSFGDNDVGGIDLFWTTRF